MEDNTLVQSSFSATIDAPMEKVDIPSWCFTQPAYLIREIASESPDEPEFPL